MISNGIYRLYKLHHDELNNTTRSLAGRILVHDGQIEHLEDHGGMDRLLPSGPVTPALERRFSRLTSSGYHELINEADIAAGHHPDEVQDLDVGPVEAEHKFIMTGDGVSTPAMVEMWDDIITVDGRELDAVEAHSLLNEVAGGRIVLTPI